MGTILSPLRYPGGKSSLAPMIAAVLEHNGLAGCVYAEPFAGGAGAAIKLLFSGHASKIALNDADPAIYAFWQAILDSTEDFLRLLMDTPITVEEWKKQREIWKHPHDASDTEKGFATFFLNRANRSGILDGYPIGGLNQTGSYPIDARYNKQNLVKRISDIAIKRNKINITCLDALDFLSGIAMRVDPPFVYLDPPYVEQGGNLYMNSYKAIHHEMLAKWLAKSQLSHWMMTYDIHPLIQNLYRSWCNIEEMSLAYSAQTKRKAFELLISPPKLELPPLPVKRPSRGLSYAG